MAKFIKVYDKNGKYAINPEDCPITVEKGSMIINDLDGNITICKKPTMNLFVRPDDIIECNLKTGHVGIFCSETLFINDPKYGIIHTPSYNSMEECFTSWNEEDNEEPRGYGIPSDLLTLDRQILIDFLKKILEYVVNPESHPDYLFSKIDRLNLASQDCFGLYYGNIDSDKLNDLSNEELVYFILQCENYYVTDHTFGYNDLKVHGIFQHKYLLPCGCHSFYESECDHKI
jgi:hypothetical protein